MSRLGQFLQQIGRAQKARAQQPVIGLDLVHQLLRRRRAQLLRQQVHVQRQHVAGLRVAALALRIRIVDLPERRRAVVRASHKSIVVHKLLLETPRESSRTAPHTSASSAVRPVACAICRISVTS